MKHLMYFGVLAFLATGCNRKSEYHAIERAELARGVRQDSLFEGLYLGMGRTEFREHCLKKNRQRKFVDGAYGKVQFKTAAFGDSATMLFYPDFVDEKISQMPVLVAYSGWAPWNEHLNSEVLEKNVRSSLLKQYGGNEFVAVKGEGEKTAWVKVDGNRRITVYRFTDSDVKIIFKDLSVTEATHP